LLIAALCTGERNVFPTALEDRMHQPFRQNLVPGLREILQLRAPGLLGCALSGAGPSVLVFYETGSEKVCDLVQQIFVQQGHGAEILPAPVARRGYTLTEE
jgi:homoserine kinase